MNSILGELDIFKNDKIAGFYNEETAEYIPILAISHSKTAADAPAVLSKVNQLRIQTLPAANSKSANRLGIDLQGAERLFPEAIEKKQVDSTGMYGFGVSNLSLNAIALKAIQEQQTLIEGQKKK